MGDTALYRPILKKAWQITTKFKSLWFFGLFAAVLSSGGEFELLSKVLFNANNKDQGLFTGILESFKMGLENSLTTGESLWSGIWTSITSSPTSLLSALMAMLIGIAIAGFVIWLAVVSQIGLIRNINLSSKNKKNTINEGIDKGVDIFWPVLIVNIAYKLVLFAVFATLGKEILLLVILGTTGIFLHVISLVILSAIVVIISFLVRYQILYMVLKNQDPVSAFKSSFILFKNNWLISLEMAFILFVVYIVAAYLTAFLTSIFLAVPLVFITYSHQIPIWAIMFIGLMSISAVFIVTFLITAVLSVFQWSSWTLLFNRINSKGAISSIIRLSERSPNVPISFKRK